MIWSLPRVLLGTPQRGCTKSIDERLESQTIEDREIYMSRMQNDALKACFHPG